MRIYFDYRSIPELASPAPWCLVVPLAFIGGLVWAVFMLWVRKRLL